ncbi:MAG TPA: polysaccharide deacetylase family protein [Panacibacter sp.]|nr:polysaccharide deacetylase family protein [Panacibacter sp.]
MIFLILTAGVFLRSGAGRETADFNINLRAEQEYSIEKKQTVSLKTLPEIPVLSYHQVRDWKSSDSKAARVYIMPVGIFKEQMQMLADSGYQAILPEQLTAYPERGEQLPEKPVMLTFDDGTGSQYSNALPLLNKANYKAVFFIMTVTLNHNGYMSNNQIKTLAQQGHIIGCHTWDHHRVTEFKEQDWDKQILKPAVQLQNITGRPVKYFAYPYGIWSTAAIAKLKGYGFDAAFQLSLKKDTQNPLFTIRRIIVDSHWDAAHLQLEMKKNFH